MAFDIRHSKVASWLNVIGALIAIAGLGSEFFPKFLPTLQQPIPIPLWALLATIAVSPTIAVFLARRLQPSRDEPTMEQPADELKTVATIEDGQRDIESLKSQLNSYRTLENEVLSVFASGEEWDLNGLTGRLKLTHSEDGHQRVRLAVASLIDQKRIGSVGTAPFAKLKYLAQ